MGEELYRIGVIENEEEFRVNFVKRLYALPNTDIVFSWESAETFWRDRRGRSLDILFLDIMLSGMSGVELARELAVRNPEIRIVMLTNLGSDELIFDSIRHGALGYLLKSELKDLTDTIHTVMSGGAIITPTIAFRVFGSFKKRKAKTHAQLSTRERQVLEEMVRGKTVARVAALLGLSEHTIQTHVKHIYRKLNVSNRAEMAAEAIKLDLL